MIMASTVKYKSQEPFPSTVAICVRSIVAGLALLPRLFGRIPRHTTRAPPVGFELETNGIQFYAIANLDKTSYLECSSPRAWAGSNR